MLSELTLATVHMNWNKYFRSKLFQFPRWRDKLGFWVKYAVHVFALKKKSEIKSLYFLSETYFPYFKSQTLNNLFQLTPLLSLLFGLET